MTNHRYRPMQPDDWTTLYFPTAQSHKPVRGFKQTEGVGGSPLHAVEAPDRIEQDLTRAYRSLGETFPGIQAARIHAWMPYWQGPEIPHLDDYQLLDAPQRLTTTAITVVKIPMGIVNDARLGFCFQENALPSLRERMMTVPFHGIVGNLGYYMTADLINGASAYAHNVRYPSFPLPNLSSYIGFYWYKNAQTGDIQSTFQGAHPSAIAIRRDGHISILPQLAINAYQLQLGNQTFTVDVINAPQATEANIVAFTPGMQTDEVKHYIDVAEKSVGADQSWQSFAPMIPLADAADRVHVFLANTGNGYMPYERVIEVWLGKAPLPSFGTVLSFKRAYFEMLFQSVEYFKTNYLNTRCQIIPLENFDAYTQIMSGFVPVIIDEQDLYLNNTVREVMVSLSRYGNANSPIAQLGRETENFHPLRREPAGILFQTRHAVGWILFDGRHELSIGANVVDIAILLKKLLAFDWFDDDPIQHAIFIDGGSAMKMYHVESYSSTSQLHLLNRVAAGARNGPNYDPYGLNFYSSLSLNLTGR